MTDAADWFSETTEIDPSTVTHMVLYSEDDSWTQGFVRKGDEWVPVDEFHDEWPVGNGWVGGLHYRKDGL